jgi:hypothetical protein
LYGAGVDVWGPDPEQFKKLAAEADGRLRPLVDEIDETRRTLTSKVGYARLVSPRVPQPEVTLGHPSLRVYTRVTPRGDLTSAQTQLYLFYTFCFIAKPSPHPLLSHSALASLLDLCVGKPPRPVRWQASSTCAFFSI